MAEPKSKPQVVLGLSSSEDRCAHDGAKCWHSCRGEPLRRCLRLMEGMSLSDPEAKLGPALGPDAPRETNTRGGQQSVLPYRFDLIPTESLFRLAGILHTGAERYGVDNWRLIDTRSHLNHAIAHVFAHLQGDRSDDHLGHALCRLLFACAMEEQDEP